MRFLSSFSAGSAGLFAAGILATTALPLGCAPAHDSDIETSESALNPLLGTRYHGCSVQDFTFGKDSTTLIVHQQCGYEASERIRRHSSDVAIGGVSIHSSAHPDEPMNALVDTRFLNVSVTADGKAIALGDGEYWQVVEPTVAPPDVVTGWRSTPRTLTGDGRGTKPLGIQTVRIHPDGHRVALMGFNGAVFVLDGVSVRQAAPEVTTFDDRGQIVYLGMDVSADGALAVVTHESQNYGGDLSFRGRGWSTTATTIAAYDFVVPGMPPRWKHNTEFGGGQVAISGNKRFVAFAPSPLEEIDKRVGPKLPVELYDGRNGDRERTIGTPVSAHRIRFSNDGVLVLVAGAFDEGFDGTRVYRTKSGALVASFADVTKAALSPDHKYIALFTPGEKPHPKTNLPVETVVVQAL